MDRELTVVEHLNELRRCLIVSLAALGISTLLSVPFSSTLLKILKSPASGLVDKLAFFGPEEAFVVYMRVSFLAGFLVAFPVIAYQLWAFLSPAIEERFKRHVFHFIFFSSLAFIGGCLFAYSVLLPNALKFLLSLGEGELEPVISATRYISFVTGIMICCGIVFQMPIASFLLTRVGLLNARALRRNFKYAAVVMFILAAVITPTGDAFNMCLVAIPMLLLYEVSIWVSALARKRGVVSYPVNAQS